MRAPAAIVYVPGGGEPPRSVLSWCEERQLSVVPLSDSDELMAMALRGRPRVVLLDGRASGDAALELCRRLKADSYTGIVPAAVVCGDSDADFSAACDSLADEVLRASATEAETHRRLDLMLRRSDRDTGVHPSTRLPGTATIEAEIERRIATGESFAVCYADLDYFKEYNDRYSYREGDRVIRILAGILHDCVKGIAGESGFVGHIGGDDFIFIIHPGEIARVCGEIVEVFDLLIHVQYSEQDRRAGYFFGKDRRGHLHRVPLMTLSIGVITNLRRNFVNALQVSALANEMKSYAKTLPGSIYAVDRRSDDTDTRSTPERKIAYHPPVGAARGGVAGPGGTKK
jgi:diguanylate cyclase (GGDEF)-like protein